MLICTLCSVLILDNYAQDNMTYRNASYLYNHQRYREAIPLLEGIVKQTPNDAYAHYMLGKSYMFCFSYPNSLVQLKESYQLNPNVDPEILFWLGYAYHLNYDFVTAKSYYQKYLPLLHKTDPRIDVTKKSILECEYGMQFFDKPAFCEIKNMGPEVNSLYSDHSPVVTQNNKTMYFTSRRGMDSLDVKDMYGEYAEDIFVSHMDAAGNWSTPVYSGINTDEHDAVIQLYQDTVLVMYRNKKMGDIYKVTQMDSTWSAPVEIVGANTDYTETHLFYSADGKRMFLATDRESIRGDFDLYVADKLDNGKWGDFVNMGDTINTDYDENSPYVSADGNTLFFSSNGHTSMGGYDIFKSERDTATGKWSQPLNLGFPFNTPGDDIYFYYANEESLTGYFSSYRNSGYGEKDIYEVTFMPVLTIEGEVIDVATNLPVDSVDLFFCHTKKDSLHNPLYVKDRVQNNTASYKVSLLSGHNFTVYIIENGDTLARGKFRTPKINLGDPVHYKYKVRINRETGTIEGEVVDIEVTESPAVAAVQTPVRSNSSHTNGEDAGAVVLNPEYNSNNNSTNNPTGNSENNFINSVQAGDSPFASVPSISGSKPLVTSPPEYFGIKDVTVGCGSVLYNVYFDFNSATLDEARSMNELDNLVCFINQNPGCKIEISGHTDNVGSATYNKDLSQRRAQAIVNYLVKKGVSRKRLVAKGYGEEKPIASNDDEEEGREYNRRTEFKVLSK